jgi:hypothetical protein
MARFEVSYSDILTAFKKTKPNKSAGMTGWSHEWITDCIFVNDSEIQRIWAHIFSDYVNVEISTVEEDILSNGVLIVFKYATLNKTKLRPIILKEFFLKMAFHLVIPLCQDDEIKKSGHVFGRPGGTQLSLAAIQASLDDGRVVVSGDGRNTFNCLCRHAFFEYVKQKPFTYSKSFKLLNLCYGRTTRVFAFRGSDVCFEQSVRTGSNQGCVSAGWAFTVTSTPVANRFPHSLAIVSDDIHHVGKNSLEEFPRVAHEYRKIGIDILGPKLRIFSSKPIALPKFYSDLGPDVCVYTKPVKVNGGIITPSFKTAQQNEFMPVFQDVIEGARNKMNRLLTLPCRKQDKMLILSHMAWSYIFLCESVFSPVKALLFEALDAIHRDAAISIMELSPEEVQDRHVHQLFLQPEDGGFGLLPLTLIASLCIERRTEARNEYLQHLSLPINLQQASTTSSSIAEAWRYSALLSPSRYAQQKGQRHYLNLGFGADL